MVGQFRSFTPILLKFFALETGKEDEGLHPKNKQKKFTNRPENVSAGISAEASSPLLYAFLE